MHKVKTYYSFRRYYLLMNVLEAKSFLTKLGGANDFDHASIYIYDVTLIFQHPMTSLLLMTSHTFLSDCEEP